MCLGCVPATFGNADPVGGLTWQEVQLVSVSGDPAVWHTVQSGAEESGEVPDTAWQTAQPVVNPVGVTAVCAAPRKGTEWFAPPVQENALWSVLWQVNVPHVWPWAV